MKLRYRYQIYPLDSHKIALAKLFGCVRVVWNDALGFCKQSYQKGKKYQGGVELHKQFITQAKS